MKKYKPRNLRVLFDNAGGITIDCPRFCHHYYGNYDYEVQAARDFFELVNGIDLRGFEGHEPEARIGKKPITGDNALFTSIYLINRVKKLSYQDIKALSGCAQRNFCAELKKLVTEKPS